MLDIQILALAIYTTGLPGKVITMYTIVAQVNMRKKLYAMSKELVLDSVAKVREAAKFKQHYQYSAGYQVGEAACQARKKYESMLGIYARSIEFYDELNTTELIEKMIAMQDLYSDAHNIVRMIEIWHNGDNLLFRASYDPGRNDGDVGHKFVFDNSGNQSNTKRKKNQWAPKQQRNVGKRIRQEEEINNPSRVNYGEDGFDTDNDN